MTLFNNSYSGIITRGLGGTGCCFLITAPFGIVCGCTVTPIPSTGSGGGGGSYAVHPGIYVPFRTKLKQPTKLVQITVKIRDHSWRHSYTVSHLTSEVIIKVFSFVNTTTSRISVGVDTIRKASKRVLAIFKKDDK